MFHLTFSLPGEVGGGGGGGKPPPRCVFCFVLSQLLVCCLLGDTDPPSRIPGSAPVVLRVILGYPKRS